MSEWHLTGNCGMCHKPAPIPVEHRCNPEPTFTLAQVKEIIEGIAVRVEGITVEDIQLFAPYKEEAISLTKVIVAKLIRETQL